jgi:hypothetical protein
MLLILKRFLLINKIGEDYDYTNIFGPNLQKDGLVSGTTFAW